MILDAALSNQSQCSVTVDVRAMARAANHIPASAILQALPGQRLWQAGVHLMKLNKIDPE